MSNINTELMTALLKNESLDEVFRKCLEEAVNGILQAELSAFLGYEKYGPEGYGSGDSRNGSYERDFDTKYGVLHISVPRDRNGDFEQRLFPPYARRSEDLENTIILLYQKGVTTREIAELIEKLYGKYYTPATVSNITKTVEGQVLAFHNRQLSEQYAVIFMDATYMNVRRDSVAKEALHVLLGITPDGSREILDYALYPSESAANYEEMLGRIRERGVRQVLLFASDGLQGIRDAVNRQFPGTRHQQCWVHLSRTVSRHVRQKDRKTVLDDLKTVYRAENAESAKEALTAFLGKHRAAYPRLHEIFDRARDSLFRFYEFPPEIRASIYTTNLIERSNKGLKHLSKLKEQFPNEDSLDRFVCGYYSEANRKYAERAQKGFLKAASELLLMFEQEPTEPDGTRREAA